LHRALDREKAYAFRHFDLFILGKRLLNEPVVDLLLELKQHRRCPPIVLINSRQDESYMHLSCLPIAAMIDHPADVRRNVALIREIVSDRP
jgi:hypothetical protein